LSFRVRCHLLNLSTEIVIIFPERSRSRTPGDFLLSHADGQLTVLASFKMLTRVRYKRIIRLVVIWISLSLDDSSSGFSFPLMSHIFLVPVVDPRPQGIKPFQVLLDLSLRFSKTDPGQWLSRVRMRDEVCKHQMGMSEKKEVGLLVVAFSLVNLRL
jgi:hypothetical protein